jgi:hypothetical protein
MYFAKADRQQRPDVAAAFQAPQLNSTGYDVAASVSGIAQGTYAVKLLMRFPDTVVECDPHKQVRIR